MDLQNPNCTQRLSQVLADCSLNRHSQTTLEPDPPMNGFVRDCYCSRSYEKTKALPRSWAMPRPDCGGIIEGNSEQRWLEQVELVARRLTIPQWQSWGRGQKLPLRLVAAVEPVFSTSQGSATATGTELTSACVPFGVNTEGFTLNQDGATKGPQSSTHLTMHGLDHISQVGESRTDTDVLERHFNMATDNLGWMSAGLEGFGSLEESRGNKRVWLHTCHTQGTPFKKMLNFFTTKSNNEIPICSGRIS